LLLLKIVHPVAQPLSPTRSTSGRSAGRECPELRERDAAGLKETAGQPLKVPTRVRIPSGLLPNGRSGCRNLRLGLTKIYQDAMHVAASLGQVVRTSSQTSSLDARVAMTCRPFAGRTRGPEERLESRRRGWLGECEENRVTATFGLTGGSWNRTLPESHLVCTRRGGGCRRLPCESTERVEGPMRRLDAATSFVFPSPESDHGLAKVGDISYTKYCIGTYGGRSGRLDL
jgi:hypothetical protein